jgi:hypothetical protein
MSRKANRLKTMGGLLVVAMAMFAVFAGQASATSTGPTWTTTESSAEAMEIGAEAEGSSVLTGIVSTLPIELTAKKVEATTGTTIQEAFVKNEKGEITARKAQATGALKYSELSLQKPVGCGPPASITTAGLKGELISAPKLAQKWGLKLQPSSTTAPTVFATITLTGECALAGTPFKVTVPSGSYFCGEVEEVAGKNSMLEKQPIRSSATINKECGGVLEAGSNPAVLTGNAVGLSKPGGKLSGLKWGAE